MLSPIELAFSNITIHVRSIQIICDHKDLGTATCGSIEQKKKNSWGGSKVSDRLPRIFFTKHLEIATDDWDHYQGFLLAGDRFLLSLSTILPSAFFTLKNLVSILSLMVG